VESTVSSLASAVSVDEGTVTAGDWLVIWGLAIAGAEGVGTGTSFGMTTGVGMVTCFGACIGWTIVGEGTIMVDFDVMAGKCVTGAATALAGCKVRGAGVTGTTVVADGSTDIGS
jgi:hypothetical protein